MLKINNYSNYILKDISLEIDEKNLIILGENGAGKTTLAKVLAGLVKSTCVNINNINPSNVFDTNKVSLINYIPSHLDIFDEFISVSDYLKLSNISSTKNINDVLSYLDISYLEDKLCKNLSSGQAQLVMCASSILHNALYTIFDEPTSNLDPSHIKNVFKLLSNNEKLKNKIIISHDLNLSYKLKYDIIYIKDGKITFRGTSNEFFSQNNLDEIFDGSVKIIQDNIVVDF